MFENSFVRGLDWIGYVNIKFKQFVVIGIIQQNWCVLLWYYHSMVGALKKRQNCCQMEFPFQYLLGVNISIDQIFFTKFREIFLISGILHNLHIKVYFILKNLLNRNWFGNKTDFPIMPKDKYCNSWNSNQSVLKNWW